MRAIADSAGSTHIGRARPTNQDHFLIAHLEKTLQIASTSSSATDQNFHSDIAGELLVVADGMGGRPAGERASRLAIESVAEYVLNLLPWFFRLRRDSEDDLIEELKAGLSTAQDRLFQHAKSRPDDKGMGTTLTMAYVIWPCAYVVHAGDSRCYLHRQGKLVQITQDQTVAQAYLEKGAISAEEVENSPFRNVLWNVVAGDSKKLEPTVYRLSLSYGDQLLLCTDGLTSQVAEAEICEVLENPLATDAQCQLLIDSANESGGRDNITVVVARMLSADQTKDVLTAGQGIDALDETVVED